MSNTTPSRTDVYARVTDRIIADLEAGVRPWLKPWKAGNAEGRIAVPRRHNGTPYRGINILLLWGAAMAKGYSSPLWMTFRQAGELKAHVRKGEHGSLVVFADRVAKTETNDQGEEVEREIAFMKGYTVFNVEQIEGLPAHYYAKAEPKGDPLKLIESARGFLRRHRRHLPPWRRQRLLRPRSRLHPASAARSVQGCGKLRGRQRPRNDPLDRPSVAPGACPGETVRR